MTTLVYISQMIRGLASRKVQLAEIFWRYKALQVNLDHAHTALQDQTYCTPKALSCAAFTALPGACCRTLQH